MKQFKHNRTLRSSAAMQLEIPRVSHIYQDQAAKSVNILPGCVRNRFDFNHFSKMTFKDLMKKVKDNLSAQRFYYALSNKYIDYYLLPLDDIF